MKSSWDAENIKSIHDGVHDYINIEGIAVEVLDTKPIQRLRHVSQLGMADLVYPSANHSRFEHSLGVYHILKETLKLSTFKENFSQREKEHALVAALLHDIGHGPFSHDLENLIEDEMGKHHESLEDILEHGGLGSVLESHNLDAKLIADVISGRGILGQLLSSELDVDRMDYLIRDAYHTGVSFGHLDYNLLINNFCFYDDKIALAGNSVDAAESLLFAKLKMNKNVYKHPVARIGQSMLERATEVLIKETDITATDLRRSVDRELISLLESTESTRGITDRLQYRNLYERAIWVQSDSVPQDVRQVSREERRDLERRIAATAGREPDEVIIDASKPPEFDESKINILAGAGARQLENVSPFVRSMRVESNQRSRFGVYAPPKATESVADAAIRQLGLAIKGDERIQQTHTPGTKRI